MMVTKDDIKYYRRVSQKSYFVRFNIEMAIVMILLISSIIFFLFETKRSAERDGKTFNQFFQQYLQKNAEEHYKSASFSEAVQNLHSVWFDMFLFAVLLGVWCHHSVHIKRCQRVLNFIEKHYEKTSDLTDNPSS